MDTEDTPEVADTAEEFDNPLSLSDEDFLNSDINQYETAAIEDEAAGTETAEDTSGDVEEEDGDDLHEEDQAQADEANEATEDDADDQAADADEADDGTELEPEAKDPETDEQPDVAAEYAKILAPFKAAGGEMQVKSAEEAITLMQMGAGFHKSMEALAPHKRTLKVLDQNKIDGTTLNYLIDLKNGNPAAINKLLKEHKVDPMNGLDDDESKQYNPTEYNNESVEREVAVEQVLDRIKDTPTFEKLMDTVADKWDKSSKHELGNAPESLAVINDHMQRGVYDLISTEVSRMKSFGQLQGLNDFTAYNQVGDLLNSQGAFAHLYPARNPDATVTPSTPAARRVSPKKVVENPELNERRRAASASKVAGAHKGKNFLDINPLGMSDEDFLKRANLG